MMEGFSLSLPEKKRKIGELKKNISAINLDLAEIHSKLDYLNKRKLILQKEKKEMESEATLLERSCQLPDVDFKCSDFQWSQELHNLKTSMFGIESFRPYQEEVINATMSKHDVILIMPTGGGKSLCFQLPALLSEGITLVVSPLVSLMEDQAMTLQDLGIAATLLSASTSRDHLKVVLQDMVNPKAKLKLLYVTPEKIAKSKRFMAQLQKAYDKGMLSRIVIDEVHCCSQWGHDFRPDYKVLGILKRQFPDSPILGLTATASTSVVYDVKSMLNIAGCDVIRSTYNRANLFYEVRFKPPGNEFTSKLVELLKGEFANQSGIIYCFSRKDTENVAHELNSEGVRAAAYHAYIEPQARSMVHKDWRNGRIKVVVATTAFGMGIDKPDVRFVVHHSLSKSMENYYQESGRAAENVDLTDTVKTILRILNESDLKDQRLTGLKLLELAGKHKNQTGTRKLSKSTYQDIILHLLLEGYLKEDFHFTPYSTISYICLGPRAHRVQSDSSAKVIIPMTNMISGGKGFQKREKPCTSKDVSKSINEDQFHGDGMVKCHSRSDNDNLMTSESKKEDVKRKTVTEGKNEVIFLDDDDSDDGGCQVIMKKQTLVGKKVSKKTTKNASKLSKRVNRSQVKLPTSPNIHLRHRDVMLPTNEKDPSKVMSPISKMKGLIGLQSESQCGETSLDDSVHQPKKGRLSNQGKDKMKSFKTKGKLIQEEMRSKVKTKVTKEVAVFDLCDNDAHEHKKKQSAHLSSCKKLPKRHNISLKLPRTDSSKMTNVIKSSKVKRKLDSYPLGDLSKRAKYSPKLSEGKSTLAMANLHNPPSNQSLRTDLVGLLKSTGFNAGVTEGETSACHESDECNTGIKNDGHMKRKNVETMIEEENVSPKMSLNKCDTVRVIDEADMQSASCYRSHGVSCDSSHNLSCDVNDESFHSSGSELDLTNVYMKQLASLNE
ncbi:uncharacterized protein [Apostichopus japonicus]|uniref:uncharacterized protein isoform X2 n=1 Tax=Stichopus japonicus TaxID=307972 RepID=UPI003AB59785